MRLNAIFATTALVLSACQAENTENSIYKNEKPEAVSVEKATLFNEGVSDFWQAATHDDATKENYLVGVGASENSQWQIIDLEDGIYNKVLDVQFFQKTGFSDFGFHASTEGGSSLEDITSFNLSEFSDGFFTFDYKILDYGQSKLGLYVHVECTWPCRSQYLPVANRTGTDKYSQPGFPMLASEGEWYTAKIPVVYLTNDNLSREGHPNLDLTKVSKVVIDSVWNSATEQIGFHFQIDNIRFEK